MHGSGSLERAADEFGQARNGDTVAVALPSVGGEVELGVGNKFSLNYRVTFGAYLAGSATPGTNIAGTVKLDRR